MATARQIEHEVESLPPAELRAFRQWFETFDADKWDEQFEADAQSGKLDVLADQSIADLKRGNFKGV